MAEREKIKQAALRWYAAREACYGPMVGKDEYIRASNALAHALGKTNVGDPGHPKHPRDVQWAKDHPELAAQHCSMVASSRSFLSRTKAAKGAPDAKS